MITYRFAKVTVRPYPNIRDIKWKHSIMQRQEIISLMNIKDLRIT